MQQPLWQPNPQSASASQMARFIERVRLGYDEGVRDYAQLHQWSIDNKETFWSELWRFCEVKAHAPWQRALDPGDALINSEWFVGSTLNFAENLLGYCAKQPDAPAIVFLGEDRVRRELSYDQLWKQVARMAASLRAAGLKPGDRVAAFIPNLPEAVVAMLATASLGGVWSSCSPDFGFNGVMDRFGQIEPVFLICADGYFYKGKQIDSLARVKELADALPTIRQIIVVPYLNAAREVESASRMIRWDEFLSADPNPPLHFVPLSFNHPVYIMYSSGTTGVPKCIVHGAGGTLLQHLKEHRLHTDITPGDRFFYFTTCGWMMWNWLVSGLASGATLVLYDGSPFHPSEGVLLDMAAREGVNVFGTSAKYIAAVEKAGVIPKNQFDLSTLKVVLSTGSPLAPESFDYLYRAWKSDMQVSSISGGTDIVSCFALGNPCLPVYRGELQCRGLGMQVEIYDQSGRAVVEQKGELVCGVPFPSMPVFFWNDQDGEKYRAAYFERFDGVWAQGDYAEITSSGGLIIYGRSDAVLNPGGVRIGTAEIYRQVEKLNEILESIAVGQEWRGDTRVVLFVKLRDGVTLDDRLRSAIKKLIRDNTTVRHVPDKILEVADIPRTISGKIVELAVTHVIHNREVKNTDALANPEALALFANRPELTQ